MNIQAVAGLKVLVWSEGLGMIAESGGSWYMVWERGNKGVMIMEEEKKSKKPQG